LGDVLDSVTEINEELYLKLKNKYLKEFKDKGEQEWSEEEPNIKKIIPLLQKKIDPRFKIKDILGIGGTSIILLLDDVNLTTMCALKFPRPQTLKVSSFAEVIDKEISILLQVQHPNIIRVYDHGEIDYNIDKVSKLPFYIMEYIYGAKNLKEYLEVNNEPNNCEIHQKINKITLFKILEQTAKAISKLHELKIVHLDIKLENVLITPEGNAKLSDLGSGRQLSIKNEDPNKYIEIILDDRWAHPDLVEEFRGLYRTEHARTRGTIKRNVLKESFDLYAFGKNIHRLIKLYEPGKWENFEVYDKNYLELLGCRLLDSQHKANEKGLGLPCEIFKEICYNNITEVIDDLQKITGEYSIYNKVPELNQFYEATIQTANIRPTPFTPRLKDIIETSPFLRLGYVSQLGFANLLYPTATHSRLEHLLGTYSNVVRYCDSLYNDPINPVFKQIMTETDIKSVLLAALFHDIGQYPLAHDLEEAESFFSHEDVTEFILKNPETNKEFLDYIQQDNGWGCEISRIISIIKGNPNGKNVNYSIKDFILHTLIDCPIDADKLDYIVRDGNNLGMTVGRSIDQERFFKTITIVFSDKKEKDHLYASLGIYDKGKVQAESIAFSRYILFKTVYWHHTTRAIKSMIHQAVWEVFYEEPRKNKGEIKKELHDFIIKNLEAPQQFSSDYQTLDWLEKNTSESGKRLLEMIQKRKIFKRLLVISKKENPDIWTLLHPMRDPLWTGDRSLALQREFQSVVIEFLKGISETNLENMKISKKEIDDIIARNNKEILFLIDIPKERGSSNISLEYFPESDHSTFKESWKDPRSLGESEIWSYLTLHFNELVGNARVFVDPSIRDTIKKAIPHYNRKQLLKRAICGARDRIMCQTEK